MSKENGTATAEKIGSLKPESGKRQRSSIAFPYLDLGEAISVATAIHNHVGTGPCGIEQLAAWVNMSPKSSGFRSRMSASSLFGLVNNDRSDAIQLTELGRLVVDAKREREGRAKAFLAVPLFRAVYDKFKGGAIPPAAALENELVALGVASTLKSAARSVLERSADKAGFFETGKDRLVMPGFRSDSTSTSGGEIGGGGGGGDDPPSGELHPMIAILLQVLPEAGTAWPQNARAKWMQALSKSFDTIYKTGE
jgi:hypothetical protein